ncbi:phosphate ABC transporter permease subunit PstC [Allobacillus salarius]|uniref:Phosphate transport system permease protein n=2 Tax=Bacillaceae TaxID=186817 RepID=A0A556PL26_9BACI|nr:phosphate ABC transporter permease subunit PstC [Allobacillus salarius]TSJ65093.1 phosphate ABC transporter permease subunit PstC [Allobacillus salarius]
MTTKNVSVSTANLSTKQLMNEKKSAASIKNVFEKMVPAVLFLFAAVSVLTTIAILYTLITEAVHFFQRVSFTEFFTSTNLKPLSQNPSFGLLPLLSGTLLSTIIAMVVAGPIGLMAAIYLSEYASDRVRKLLKPMLELLAGIPTIVYGFFAFTFVTPLLRSIWPEIELTNILSPGLVMGIMIIPMVASLSEDAMNSVPNTMREGAYGLGATKLETAIKVVIPAAISGIVASFVLAISRAIGETMIVTIASGSTKNFSFDVTESMQTMTAYIVEVSSGDAAAGTTVYYSIYAVALTLFTMTFLMNLLAKKIARRFREEY